MAQPQIHDITRFKASFATVLKRHFPDRPISQYALLSLLKDDYEKMTEALYEREIYNDAFTDEVLQGYVEEFVLSDGEKMKKLFFVPEPNAVEEEIEVEEAEDREVEEGVEEKKSLVGVVGLPVELFTEILSFLPVRDLLRVSETCQRYHAFICGGTNNGENEAEEEKKEAKTNSRVIWRNLVMNIVVKRSTGEDLIHNEEQLVKLLSLDEQQQGMCWKQYFRDLYFPFDNSIVVSRRHTNGGIIELDRVNTGFWSNRILYYLTVEGNEEFHLSFELLLETGDSDIVVAFSSKRNMKESLTFRISGEADMTGTNVTTNGFVPDEFNDDPEGNNGEFIYYKDSTPITYGQWLTLDLKLSSRSLSIDIGGQPVFEPRDMTQYLFPKYGYVGLFHSDFRPFPVHIRHITGSFQRRLYSPPPQQQQSSNSLN